jgi:hypothetical protein
MEHYKLIFGQNVALKRLANALRNENGKKIGESFF